MTAKRLDNKGYSLIEVIVAMVLIGIVSAAFSSVYFTANKASTNNADRLQALFLAQEILEDIRAERDAYLIIDGQDLAEYFINNGYENDSDIYKMDKDYQGKDFQIEITFTDVFDDDYLYEIVIDVFSQNASPLRLATRLLL